MELTTRCLLSVAIIWDDKMWTTLDNVFEIIFLFSFSKEETLLLLFKFREFTDELWDITNKSNGGAGNDGRPRIVCELGSFNFPGNEISLRRWPVCIMPHAALLMRSPSHRSSGINLKQLILTSLYHKMEILF